MLCPKDGSACPDDLCRGSGCMEMDGYPMLTVCAFCGGTIDDEIPDCSICTCDGDEPGYCDDCGNFWENCKCSLTYPKASSNADFSGPSAEGVKGRAGSEG